MDFWISLCCQFEVNEQLTSLINILNFLLQLPDDKDDGETKTCGLLFDDMKKQLLSYLKFWSRLQLR